LTEISNPSNGKNNNQNQNHKIDKELNLNVKKDNKNYNNKFDNLKQINISRLQFNNNLINESQNNVINLMTPPGSIKNNNKFKLAPLSNSQNT
jgi:hypothetical protein